MEKRRISFGELRLNDKTDEYWNKVRQSNWVSIGDLVEEFEQKFAKLFNVKHAVGMSNGTDANINALLTLYHTNCAKLGDEIIVPALCFFSVASSVIAAGFKPVFVDIDPHTLNIDPYKIEDKLTNKTRAILAVNTMGKPVGVEPLKYISKKYGIPVINDNCEGHGCQYLGKFMEQYFPVSTYSCYQAHLIQSAEFGFCCTNDDKIANILRCTRTHGRKDGQNDFIHQYLGFNSKPTDLHACVGLSQIDEFWNRFNNRKEHVRIIRNGLNGYEHFMMFSEEEEHYTNSPHAFSITLMCDTYNIVKFKQHLTNYQIDWKLNFKCIPTQQEALRNSGYVYNHFTDKFPMAEWVGNLGVHFGVHEWLTDEDCEYIVWVVKQYFDNEMWKKDV